MRELTLGYTELSPAEKAAAERNAAMHRRAQDTAIAGRTFVICGGLLYGPSGEAIAYILNKPSASVDWSELLSRTGGQEVSSEAARG